LNWQEVAKIYHLDLTEHSSLIKYRDLFIIGCLTGFRFSDYLTPNRNQLKDGMLHVRQTKTSTKVVVPLIEEARKILTEKYDTGIPKVSMVNFNYNIKEVVRLAAIDVPVKITHKRGKKSLKKLKLF
jgi:hypothetical protein